MQLLRFRLFFCLVAASMAFQTRVSAQSASVTVCDEASLRAAIQNGRTINFGCDGTIVLSNTLHITTSTVLNASGHNVVLSGGNLVRVLFVATNIDLTVNNLTIANGKIVGTNGVQGDDNVVGDGESVFGAGIFNEGGRVVLSGCILSNNVAIGGNYGIGIERNASGAAIYSNGGSITISNSLLAGNSCLGGVGDQESQGGSSGLGGAVYCKSGTLSIAVSEFRNNSATGGTISRDGISYHPGPGFGGALYAEKGTVSITETLFLKNQANGGSRPPDPRNLSASTGSAQGGGAYFSNSMVTISQCKFLTNSSASTSDGGRSSSSTFAQGGAIFTTGKLDIFDTLLDGNSSVGGTGGTIGGHGGEAGGGAIFNLGSLTISRSTVAGNEARGGLSGSAMSQLTQPGGPGRGGGIYNGGDFSGTNSTFVLNLAESAQGWNVNAEGGGIFNLGSMTLVHATVASNAVYPGTLIFNGIPRNSGLALGAETYSINGPAVVQNTIIGNSLSGSNCFGVLIDQGNNISSDASCQFTAPGSMNNTDPLLSPLGDFGGPTPTMALLSGSPALDQGLAIFSPPTDQRGFTRPFGSAPDIGAFEISWKDYALNELTVVSYKNQILRLIFAGTNGQFTQFQTSSNLTDWTTVSTNTVPMDGVLEYLYTNRLSENSRFFRTH
jgi:hypothetical protein